LPLALGHRNALFLCGALPPGIRSAPISMFSPPKPSLRTHTSFFFTYLLTSLVRLHFCPPDRLRARRILLSFLWNNRFFSPLQPGLHVPSSPSAKKCPCSLCAPPVALFPVRQPTLFSWYNLATLCSFFLLLMSFVSLKCNVKALNHFHHLHNDPLTSPFSTFCAKCALVLFMETFLSTSFMPFLFFFHFYSYPLHRLSPTIYSQ